MKFISYSAEEILPEHRTARGKEPYKLIVVIERKSRAYIPFVREQNSPDIPGLNDRGRRDLKVVRIYNGLSLSAASKKAEEVGSLDRKREFVPENFDNLMLTEHVIDAVIEAGKRGE